MSTTCPNNLFRLTSTWDNVLVYCNKKTRIMDGWELYGITYGNCTDIPGWHKDPLVLHDNEIDMWISLHKKESI